MRILIADDHAVVRRGLRQILEREELMKLLIADDSQQVVSRLVRMAEEIAGVEIVGVAQDGAEALDLIHQADPDVAILDFRMPRRSGLEVLKIVKSRRPATRVLIVTNYASSPYRESCLAAGADFFFDKSREFEKVGETLTRLLEQCH